MHENEIGTLILDAAFQVHKELGPGLLESTYEACLSYETLQRGLFIETQLPLPVVYKEVKLDCGYRIDLRVERKVIVEIKSVERLNDVHLMCSLWLNKKSCPKQSSSPGEPDL